MHHSTTEQWEEYIMGAFGDVMPQRHTTSFRDSDGSKT